jgi:5-methylcytosine-specific restriction endonuclease McrA
MVRKSKYTKELLQPIVEDSYSMAEVLRKLNLKVVGGNYRYISCRIRYLGISTEHFLGRAWAKGKTKKTDVGVAKCVRRNRLKDKEVFCENSMFVGGGRLAKRLVDLGWEYKCNRCGLADWQGEPITLHIDHINGIGNDNRFENLRFLCPNCHQQTETWGNKKPKVGLSETNLPRIKNNCVDCDIPISKRSTRCRACAEKIRIRKTKIKWPNYQTLKKMVEKTSFLAVGKKLGVSDSAVRKRLKRHINDR